MSSFSKILIAFLLIVLVGGGYFAWQYFGAPEEEIKNETANWKTYRNEEYGFEVKYSPEYGILDSKNSENHIVLATIEEERVQREKQMGEFTAFIINIHHNDKKLELQEWLNENLSLCTGGAKKEWLSDFNFVSINEIKGLQFTVNEMMTPRHTLIKKENIIIDIIGAGIEKDLYNRTLSTFRFLE